MKRITILLILFAFIFGCEKISYNSYSYLTARIAGFDQNCSVCILEFPDNSPEVKKKIGESPENLYQAVNLNRADYEIGQWLKVRVRKPDTGELTPCKTNYSSDNYKGVFILDLEKYDKLIINDTVAISWLDCMYDPQEQILICLDSVLNDSRCPLGVQCFWEGNAEVRFKFERYPDGAVLFNLNTHKGFRNDTIVDNYKFTLTGLSPYPKIGSRISQKDYKAEILIEKKPHTGYKN